jgi:hypothetical protein
MYAGSRKVILPRLYSHLEHPGLDIHRLMTMNTPHPRPRLHRCGPSFVSWMVSRCLFCLYQSFWGCSVDMNCLIDMNCLVDMSFLVDMNSFAVTNAFDRCHRSYCRGFGRVALDFWIASDHPSDPSQSS